MKCFYCGKEMESKKCPKGIYYTCVKCDFNEFIPKEETKIDTEEIVK